MKRTSSSLAAALLIVLATATALATPPGPGRLDPNVGPTLEVVHLKLDPASESYTGSVQIDLHVENATSRFLLNADGPKITRLRLESANRVIPAKFEQQEKGIVQVTTEEPISAGKATLSIDFTAPFNTRAVGLYRMTKDGQAYAFTQFEAADGRRAFPMWDEPAWKIPFDLTLTIPSRLEAVANTPIEKSVDEGDGWKTLHFAVTRPLPSYLVAIAVGPFEFVPIKGMKVPGRVVTPAGEAALGKIAAEETPRIIAALDRYFTIDYPFRKLDLIAVPEFWPGAMENAGAITYADNILLLDPKSVTPDQMRNLIRVTAHEAAHQWFGDLVTMQWWDDLWLNESFADWMGDKITSELAPEYEHDLVELQSIQGIYNLDARASVGAIRQKVTYADEGLADVGLAYDKGKAVLRMVEQWVGPETFRRGIIAYLHQHQWGNATGSDLWSALAKSSGQDVAGPLKTFLDQPGFPLIDVTLLDGGKVRLRQQRFVNAGVDSPAEQWTVPVFLRYSDRTEVKSLTVLLSKPEQTFQLDAKKIDWIDPNADSNGYYRWNVDRAMMHRLAKHASEWLDPRERIAFIGNLSSLLDGGFIHGDDYLQMLGEFANDPQPRVLTAVLQGLAKVDRAFVNESDRPAFARYLRKTLRPALDRYGLQKKAGEDAVVTSFRPQLLEWLGIDAADPEIRAFGKKAATSYIKDPSSIDPAIAGVALRIAAADGDQALFDTFRKGIETAESPTIRAQYLGAMSAFDDPKLRAEALDYALHGGLRPNELFRIPFGAMRTDEAHRVVYSWFTSNYDELTGRIPPAFLGFMPQIAAGCDAKTLASAEKFFSEERHRTEETEKTMKRVEDQVNDCVNLRNREGSRVAKYLATVQ
ncbi:MAG: M1 family aminopeptidase [Thermoanaerobaculia bacterium]